MEALGLPLGNVNLALRPYEVEQDLRFSLDVAFEAM